MKKIKILFTDFWSDFNYNDNFFLWELRKSFICEISEAPDYVIFSCYGNNHLKYKGVKVFFTGEPVFPDFNYCDYAIGYDDITFGDRYLRWPIYRIHMEYSNHYDETILLKNISKEKEKFCSFIYSNPYTATQRDSFLEKLSDYKFVHSAGKHKNNINQHIKNDISEKNNYQSGFKFSIAFENSIYDGYTSEKIVDSILSGTIPIYYGNKNIEMDIESNSFINCHKFDTTESVIDYIKTIDQDDELYQNMLNKLELPKYDQTLFSDFLINIFDQNLVSSYRSPRGYYYSKNLLKMKLISVFEKLFIHNKVVNKLIYNGKHLKKYYD